MTNLISSQLNGFQWGSLLQHTDYVSSSHTQGTLNATNESFSVKVRNPNTQELVDLSLSEIIKISEDILKSPQNDISFRKEVGNGLKHLRQEVSVAVDNLNLRGQGVFYDILDFYDKVDDINSGLELEPGKRQILAIANEDKFNSSALPRLMELVRKDKNLLFNLTAYKESFFDLVQEKYSKEALLPLLILVLEEAHQLEPDNLKSLKKLIFKGVDHHASFFNLLMKREDANRIFDVLVALETEMEFNTKEASARIAMYDFAYSPKRYDYIFLQQKDLDVNFLEHAKNSYENLKIEFDSTIEDKYAEENSRNYQSWLNKRMSSSSSCVEKKFAEKWRLGEKKRSEYVASHSTQQNWRLELGNIQLIHRRMTTGEVENPGMFRGANEIVRTSGGWTHTYCLAPYLDENLDNFINWFNSEFAQCQEGKLNPIVFAAQSYQRLVSLHPFQNGNGRIARAIMDYVLERFHLPPPILGDDIADGLFPMDKPQDQGSKVKFIEKIILGIKASKDYLEFKKMEI